MVNLIEVFNIDKDFDIVIVGQGLVGASFALYMAKQSPALKIAVIDDDETTLKLDQFNCGSRVYAISPKNIHYLQSLGVLPTKNKVNDIEQMVICDSHTKESLELDCNMLPTSYLAKMVDSDALLFNLKQQILLQSNIYILKTKLVSFEIISQGIQLISSSETYKAKLLVGSDGVNSCVRNLAGFKRTQVDYNCIGIIANFTTEYPHLNRAFQFFTPAGILAYLPLPNGQISIVLSTDDKSLINLADKEFCELIQNLAKSELGELQLVTKPKSFPLTMSYLDKVYQNKIVLIGDAAHTIHPLAGMGVNLGFSDAKHLADLLARVPSISIADINILAKYNALRNLKVKRAIKLCDLIEHSFNRNDIITQSTRRLGMRFLGKSRLLKKLLISHAIHD